VPLVPAAPVLPVSAAPLPLAPPTEPADEPLPAELPESDEPPGGQSPLIAELPLEGVELVELLAPGGQFADELLPEAPLAPLDESPLGEVVLGEVVADESAGELVDEPEGELMEPLDCAAAADESASSALAVAAASKLSFMGRTPSGRCGWNGTQRSRIARVLSRARPVPAARNTARAAAH
jgi:hypothetical protein